MESVFYRLGVRFSRHVRSRRLKTVCYNIDQLLDPSNNLLAVTHLSNLEPPIISSIIDRPVHWMARDEFFRNPISRRIMLASGAFPVRRCGVPVSAIRRAIGLVAQGRTVGVFPEGGVATGSQSMLLGGAAKGGVCLIALHTGKPILPVAVYGTPNLRGVLVWVRPGKTRVVIAVGELIRPCPFTDAPGSRRAARRAMTEDLQREFRALHERVCAAGLLGSEEAP